MDLAVTRPNASRRGPGGGLNAPADEADSGSPILIGERADERTCSSLGLFCSFRLKTGIADGAGGSVFSVGTDVTSFALCAAAILGP